MDRRLAQTLKKISDEAAAALTRLKQKSAFPQFHLSVIEECEELGKTIGLTLPRIALPSPERLDYALKLLDSWAGGYVNLVETMTDHEDFLLLLRRYERTAWEIYRGLAEIEPFGANSPRATISNRCMYWQKESLRRLISASANIRVEVPENPSKAAKRGYGAEVRAWMRRHNIPSVAMAARKLGRSESALKSIMSDKTELRCSRETLEDVLKKISEYSRTTWLYDGQTGELLASAGFIPPNRSSRAKADLLELPKDEDAKYKAVSDFIERMMADDRKP